MRNKDKIRFDDVGDHYEPSESEAEYDDDEKQLLKKIRDRKKKGAFGDDDQEEEVLGFDDDDDDDGDFDDDESDFDDDIRKFEHDSDIEGAEDGDDDLPDRKAWGQKASNFYDTGYVDRDYDSLTAQEEELARLEEIEAIETQQRLAKELNEADFSLDVFITNKEQSEKPEKAEAKKVKKNEKKEKTEIQLKVDVSDLSKRQKRDLFRKEAPEFDGLVEDFERNLQECHECLEPVLKYLTERNKSEHPMVKLLRTRYDLAISYCNNIAFYLLLKAKKIKVKNHPVVKRMVQMKQLLQELDQKCEGTVKEQVETILAHIQCGEEIIFEDVDDVQEKPNEKTKRLAILDKLEQLNDEQSNEKLGSGDSDEEDELDEEQPSRKKVRMESDSDEDDHEPIPEEDDAAGVEITADEKRKITYQISKNKGLTAHKRKDQRNIRVKNRRKFQKAMVRRKGAVRPVRTETTRYAGEASGIKAFVRRSVKIK
ncbi:something about silencing protein 10 [Uranotaenia lowii]|uniref:something about silencing protein 10 n=1 Tax=Uranotaenia lowii TaxID=190385 RepID=UPI00247AEAA1|nr:something about silencing protein 10 [Uranotaenia lowii]